MKKRKVSLDVFEDAVLPKLQTEHKEIDALQKAINDSYDIYEEAEDGKQTPVKFTVSKPSTKAVTDDEETDEADADTLTAESVQKMIKDSVDAAIKAVSDKAPKGRNVVKALVNEREQRSADGVGDEKEPFKLPAELKSVRTSYFKREKVNGMEPEERAFRFGMWIAAAKGSHVAKEWCANNGIGLVEKRFNDETLQKLHSEGTNTAGGFLVPEEFGTDLIDLKETYGVARRLLKTIPMSSDTRTDPRRTGGLTAYPVAEGAAGTESTASWDQVRLTVKDWMVLTRMTNQLGADAVISVADKLAYEIAYAHILKEDQTVFTGDGTSTYAGITGITTALTNKWSTGGTTGLIKQGTSTTWTAIVMADFHAVVGTLPQYADTPNAGWVCHRAFYYGVMQKLELAAGGVTSLEIAGAPGTGRRQRPLFLGYPVDFAQVMPSSTASAQVSALFGDMSLGASFGDRQQDMIAFSTEASVGGQSVFERNETAVRGVARWDAVIHDVGDGSSVSGPICGLITG